MGSDVVFDSLCLDRCLRSGRLLDIVMLLLLGDAFLMVRFVSVVFRLPGSRIWQRMTWWHLTFSDLSHIRRHAGAYFRPDEIYRSWGSCVLILICGMYAEMMIYSLSSRWFLSGAYWEPSSQAWMTWAHLIFRRIAFLMPHWGIFPISVEMWRSPTDLHDHPQLWDTRQVVDSISFCVDTSRSLSWVVQPDSYSLI